MFLCALCSSRHQLLNAHVITEAPQQTIICEQIFGFSCRRYICPAEIWIVYFFLAYPVLQMTGQLIQVTEKNTTWCPQLKYSLCLDWPLLAVQLLFNRKNSEREIRHIDQRSEISKSREDIQSKFSPKMAKGGHGHQETRRKWMFCASIFPKQPELVKAGVLKELNDWTKVREIDHVHF